jgi:hypothetical protein
VVKIDDRLYVRQSVLDWYAANLKDESKTQNRIPASDLEVALQEALQPVQILMAGRDPDKWPHAKELTPYRQIVEARNEFGNLCKLAASGADTPILRRLRNSLCGDGTPNDQAMAAILLRFREGRTACGDSANVIACRADYELTEYNVRDYTFVAPTSELPAIGHGPQEIDFLHAILHEMGHWIGLEHIEGGESIMASSLETSRCIDYRTVAYLASFDESRTRSITPRPSAFTMRREQRRSARVPKVQTNKEK